MLAKDTIDGHRYQMPIRFGENIIGIQLGWNHSQQYLLFLLERGEKRIIKTVMPNEEMGSIKRV